MNRREIFKAAAATGAGLTLPAIPTLIIPPAAAEPMTAFRRLIRALDEVQSAAEAFDPSIRNWKLHVEEEPTPGNSCRLLLVGLNWRADEVPS